MAIINKEQVLDTIKPLFSKRSDFSSKVNFGHGIVIGGSYNYVGAPQFSIEALEMTNETLCNLLIKNGEAAMNLGLGTSGLALPNFLANLIHPNLKYSAFYPLESDEKYIKFNEEEIRNLSKKTSAFAIGMGMAEGQSFEIVKYLLDNTSCNLVIDADALQKCKDLDFQYRAILTPHVGEMSRLTGLKPDYIAMNQEKVAEDFAKAHNCIVILKNSITTVSNGYNTFTMRFGNSKLSKGGSGDVLSGILLGLVGSNLNGKKSDKLGYEKIKEDEDRRILLTKIGICGSYILGRCAELSPVNEFSHRPEDIVNMIPSVIDEIISL